MIAREITTWGRIGHARHPQLFNPYTLGFAVDTGTEIKTHNLLDAQEKLPEKWKVVRYEEDGHALFLVVELPNGDRKRILVRDQDGNYKF